MTSSGGVGKGDLNSEISHAGPMKHPDIPESSNATIASWILLMIVAPIDKNPVFKARGSGNLKSLLDE
jgi:hypothetical protein